ncbi:hypothetical protein [Rhizobium sp.]
MSGVMSGVSKTDIGAVSSNAGNSDIEDVNRSNHYGRYKGEPGMRITIAVAISAFVLTVAPAYADEVPANLIGHWALKGACDTASASIHIKGNSLAFGSDQGAAVEFFPGDSPRGNGAIHWSEEGVVDNFEFDSARDVLLHNAEGYGMGGTPEVYTRCAG